MVIDNHLRQGKISCLLKSDLTRMLGAKPDPEINVPHLIVKSDWVKNLHYSCELC